MNMKSVYQVDRQTGKKQTSALSKMEAIACGVQARFEESTGYSRKVTDETINIARALGVADSEIEKWASYRLSRIAHDTERLREIKTLLNKVYGSRLGVMTRSARS
jgi:hypothetical protein